jgi:hypothetical protein
MILDRFKVLKESNRHDLAHEYFNRDWVPMHFATMASWLEPAMVSYICSADFIDHIDVLKLTEAQRKLLGEIGDPVFRQTARDFMLNQTFRQDYWIRNARKLSTVERTEALRRTRVIATTDRPALPFMLRAVLTLNKGGPGLAAYDPILELLADHKVRSLGEIEQAVGRKGISLTQIVEAVILIAGCHHIAMAQDEAATARATAHRQIQCLRDRQRALRRRRRSVREPGHRWRHPGRTNPAAFPGGAAAGPDRAGRLGAGSSQSSGSGGRRRQFRRHRSRRTGTRLRRRHAADAARPPGRLKSRIFAKNQGLGTKDPVRPPSPRRQVIRFWQGTSPGGALRPSIRGIVIAVV